MGTTRRILLNLLPKFVLSRTTGFCTRIPLPTPMRAPLYRWFARRYGAALSDVHGPLHDYRSMAEFFARPLREGARPLADTELVWPCDGRVVSAGPMCGASILQVKGTTYTIESLVADPTLAAALTDGSQATVYLAPGDYHRVHMPFDGILLSCHHLKGALFPVNPGAVASIKGLFARNERVVFRFQWNDGRVAVVVMVAALNVADITFDPTPRWLARGDELGRFGFGSTVVVLLAPGHPAMPEVLAETVVRQGGAIA